MALLMKLDHDDVLGSAIQPMRILAEPGAHAGVHPIHIVIISRLGFPTADGRAGGVVSGPEMRRAGCRRVAENRKRRRSRLSHSASIRSGSVAEKISIPQGLVVAFTLDLHVSRSRRGIELLEEAVVDVLTEAVRFGIVTVFVKARACGTDSATISRDHPHPQGHESAGRVPQKVHILACPIGGVTLDLADDGLEMRDVVAHVAAARKLGDALCVGRVIPRHVARRVPLIVDDLLRMRNDGDEVEFIVYVGEVVEIVGDRGGGERSMQPQNHRIADCGVAIGNAHPDDPAGFAGLGEIDVVDAWAVRQVRPIRCSREAGSEPHDRQQSPDFSLDKCCHAHALHMDTRIWAKKVPGFLESFALPHTKQEAALAECR